MKSIIKHFALFALFAASAFAETASDLSSFFSKERTTRGGNMSISVMIEKFSRGSDAEKKALRASVIGSGPAWAGELKAIAVKAGDTPAEKTLVAEMRRAYVALMTASTEPIKADEAFRALGALNARVPVVKGGSALNW